MKNKMLTVLALMLFMSAFLLHTTAYASSPADITAPTLTARLSGETLHIEAKDEDSGVEAVYIDGHKVSYPANGVLDTPLWTYAGTGQYVSVYVVDLAGNRSGTVQVENPYYKASSAATNTSAASTPKTTESAVPAQTHPFTPEGTGTTVDNATDGGGKEFFTITTPDKNVFYLIIDRQRQSQNVYFLNAVTEDDLRSLAKKGNSNSGVSAVPTPQTTPKPETTSKTEPKSQPEKGGDSTLIFVLLAVIAAGGAGYYFKIYKPKHQAVDTDEDEPEYEEEDTPLSGETEPGDDFLSSEDDLEEFSGDDPTAAEEE
ncbi:MAG: DUF4366 domain-containing protein [Bacillota bacterium]